MNTTTHSGSPRSARRLLAAAALASIGSTPALALDVTLCVEPYTRAVPGNGALPMWGYRQVTTASECAVAGVAASPGPVITVPSTDGTLAITLVNRLNVPTSIVLAAQSLPSDGGAAVLAADLIGPACVPDPGALPTAAAHPQNCRVRSFTGETDAGATRTYTFNNLRPGTYLYQSGTHPQVQVQMGLYGMTRRDAPLASGSSARQLFVGAQAGFEIDVPVVLSEIDPEQHIAIAGTLGSADPTTWKSGRNTTLNYTPKFFLINGKMFDAANPELSDLVVANAGNGARVVLRIANAGLVSRSLMINSGTWKLLTEDGYPYPAPREQATVLVPAGKTTDALLISSAPTDGSVGRTLAIFDRRGGTDNGDGAALGGQVARIAQSGPAVPFIAAIGNQVANEGSTFSLQVSGANITSYAVSGAPGAAISPTGLVTWPVPLNTTVPFSTTLTVTGSDASTSVSQAFAVRVNHRPTIAQTGPVAVAHGSVNVPAAGVLSGASDPDGDTPLTAVLASVASTGTLTLNSDGSYSWSGPQPATGTTAVTFSAAASDPFGLVSTPKTITLNVAANVAPVAAGDAYAITLARFLGAPLAVNNATQLAALTRPVSVLTGNDSDPDGGTVVATTIARVSPVPPLVAPSTVTARRINPTGAGCPTNCPTINPGLLQSQASVTFNPDGTFTLLPHRLGNLPIITGTQVYEFRYTVRDDQNALSNQAIVRVTVN